MAGYPCSPCCEGGTCPDPGSEEFDACATGAPDELLIQCLHKMLAVVDLEFQDQDGCAWSAMNGSYVFLPTGNPLLPWLPVMTGDEFLTKMYDLDGCIHPKPNCFYPMDFDLSVGCTGGTHLAVSLSLGVTQVEEGDDACCIETFSATESFPLPIQVTNGLQFILTPNAPVDEACPPLLSATVTFYGKPCINPLEEPCPNGPIPSFTATAVVCGVRIQSNVTAGECGIVACFWSDGSQAGCDRDEVLSCEDGLPSELTMYAVDEGGCIGEHTESLSCCDCSGVYGNLSITPSSTPCSPPDEQWPNLTCADEIICYYNITAIIQCDPGQPDCENCKAGAFWEVCKLNDVLCRNFECDDCPKAVDNPCLDDPLYLDCCFTLADGTSIEVPIKHSVLPGCLEEDQCYRARLWPCECGCPGEWVYFYIYAGGAYSSIPCSQIYGDPF